MMLPQLDPGVRVVAPLRHPAERRAIGQGGHHRTGSEVNADADHICRINAAGLERGRHRLLEDADVVVRVLERPLRW